MDTNAGLNLNNLHTLPDGIKLRTLKLDSKPALKPVSVPDATQPISATRPAFALHWEDDDQGLSVDVREQEDGHLRADVSVTDVGLKQAFMSVGLFGSTGEYALVRKTVPLATVDERGCHGSADMGTLANAVKELGHEIGLVCFLVI
jgi:hypothetical protein